MMFAIRQTFPNGKRLNGSKRPGCEGLLTAGNSTPPKVAHWIDIDDVTEAVESIRAHNPGFTYEIVAHPDAP